MECDNIVLDNSDTLLYNYPNKTESRIFGFYTRSRFRNLTKYSNIRLGVGKLPKNFVKEDTLEDTIIHESIHAVLDEELGQEVCCKFDKLCRTFKFNPPRNVELLGITLENTVNFHPGRNYLKEFDKEVNP